METIKIESEEFKKAPVSKHMENYAKRFNLEVEAFIEKNYDCYNRDRKRKVYHFSGGFLASLQALERELNGYERPSSWGQGYLVKIR